jgi:hypothetical protein
MANRDLLKEAIADAKALKETAIANAKAALEEAFEPRLKSMLSAKLQEMEDMDEEIEETVTTEAKKEVEEAKSDRRDGGKDKETKRTEKMKYGKDLAEAEEIDEEMDLNEILAELEEGMDKEDMNEEEEVDVDVDVDDEEVEGEDEDEDIDLEEMSEDDLKSFIEDVIADMIEAGELEAGEEFEVEDEDVEDEDIDIDVEDEEEEIMEAKEEMDEAKEEMVDEVVDIDSIIDKMGSAGKETVKKLIDALGKAIDYTPLPSGTTGKLEEEDDEMMKEMESLRAELHEVNLLNAKLLYTNKIFRAKNLQEAQKVKVLEAFDRASNVSEVKLVFETLSEGIKTTPKTQIKESLGSASKPAGVATKAPIMEIDPQVARWQKLAGLK